VRPAGSRRPPSDHGAAAVEFALVVPLLLILVFGIINMAGLFAAQLSLNNGVRQAARQAVVAGDTSTKTCADMVTSSQQASTPPLPTNPVSGITVKTTRVRTIDGVQAATPCGTGFNASTAALGGNATKVLCDGSASANPGSIESVKVEARFQVTPLIPFPAPGLSGPYTLSAQAVYRCEFS
jgi:Flp pilus assembly protein TadG